MYLSKIFPYQHRKYSKEISHRLVMRGFPFAKTNPRQKFQVLYRLEPEGFAIVQSNIKPDWSTCLPPENTQSKEYNPDIKAGDRFRFRIAFNSVARKDGHEYPIAPKDWLSKRELGAELDIKAVRYEQTIDRSGRHHICIYRGVVDGLLLTRNCDQLLKCVTDGVGRGRAYGCGLLSIIKI